MHAHETLSRHFLTFEKWLQSEPLGSGHINDTFKIEVETGQKRQFFVLQRVNHYVFKKPEAVAANARLVAAELEKSGCELQIFAPFSALDGSDYARDAAGNFWRVMPFSQNSFSPETADSPETAFEIARAFGHFLKKLRGLAPDFLEETIPDFHNTPARWLAFEAVLAKNEAKRAEKCRLEIQSLFDQKHLFENIAALKTSKKLPLRAVHSDTKAGNVLLDATTKKAISVIDWDTAGPETALVDFADLVRSTASNLAEDDPKIENLELRLDILEAVGAGFLAETADFLTPTERENLLAGAEWIVFEQALRFLTDHLAGDTYYKIERDGHNLDRARNQLGLLKGLRNAETQIRKFL